ncbi:MAG: LysR family transcriptional regulator [Labrenzia sp.]
MTNEQLYLRVVEAGSLKAAAEQIGADPSAVSRKIAALEQRLGVKLLQRSTKRSIPTEAGQEYYTAMRSLIDQQAALEARVAGAVDKLTGRLRVAAPVDFGAEFVAPVLSALHDEAPNLQVELLLDSTFTDLVEQGVDVAIRIGRLPDSSLVTKRLGKVTRIIVASRSYVAANGAPQTPEDLKSHPFIFYRPAHANREVRFIRHGQEYKGIMTGNFCANSLSVIRTLVLEGKGIHLGPRWAFREGLEDGSLLPILSGYQLDAFPLHALFVSSQYLPTKVRTFIELMAKAIRKEASLEM